MDTEPTDQTAEIDSLGARSSAHLAADGQAALDAMGVKAAVASAYAAARERGASRCEAFVRAIHLYRSHRPELPANRAGTEVARILLAAAQSEMETDIADSGAFPRDDMERAESI